MTDEEPRLDFSRFHDQFHRPFTRECYQQYGGPWHHLKLAWEFHRKDQVIRPFWKHTFCLIGKHKWVIWKTGNTPWWSKELGKPSDYHPTCKYCSKTRVATEDEWW